MTPAERTIGEAMRTDPARVRRELEEVLREHRTNGQLLPFVEATHPKYKAGEFHRRLCAALERFSLAVTREESPRLIIIAPPRHGKTAIVSERFPVFHMGLNPGHEIACTSYTPMLAQQSSSKAREVAQSEPALAMFPQLARVALDPDRVGLWRAGRSSYLAAGVGTALTGFGGHVLIVDDPVKDWDTANSPAYRQKVDDWYNSTASTRLAPGGGVIIMATRWHDDDLTGRLLARMEAGGERWEVLHFEALSTGQIHGDWRAIGEALHPERYGKEDLRRKRTAMGATIFEALYQGRPVAVGGGMFRAALWKRYAGDPKVLARQAVEVALTIDCANEGHDGACYSVIHAVGKFRTAEGVRVRVLGEARGQWELPELTLACERAVAEWSAVTQVPIAIYIEYAANGIALYQLLSRRLTGVIAVKPRGDESYPGGSKETRAAFTLQGLESGTGPELPEDAYAISETGENFAVGIINEHATFPAGKYKDRVDTLSQYMIRVLVVAGTNHTLSDRRRMFGL